MSKNLEKFSLFLPFLNIRRRQWCLLLNMKKTLPQAHCRASSSGCHILKKYWSRIFDSLSRKVYLVMCGPSMAWQKLNSEAAYIFTCCCGVYTGPSFLEDMCTMLRVDVKFVTIDATVWACLKWETVEEEDESKCLQEDGESKRLQEDGESKCQRETVEAKQENMVVPRCFPRPF